MSTTGVLLCIFTAARAAAWAMVEKDDVADVLYIEPLRIREELYRQAWQMTLRLVLKADSASQEWAS